MKIKVNRNNTSWLSHLGLTTVFSSFIFCMSFVVFILSLAYSVSGKNAYTLNVTAFYYSLMLVIIEVFSVVFFVFNIFSWIGSYKKSFSSRKGFNFTFILSITPFVFIMFIDAIIRLFYVVAGLGAISSYVTPIDIQGNEVNINLAIVDFSKQGLFFGNFSDEGNALKFGNFGFNVFILMIATISISTICLVFHFSQKKKFHSEEKENAQKSVQLNYRQLEFGKMKKQMLKQKNKNKDISKKIKVF